MLGKMDAQGCALSRSPLLLLFIDRGVSGCGSLASLESKLQTCTKVNGGVEVSDESAWSRQPSSILAVSESEWLHCEVPHVALWHLLRIYMVVCEKLKNNG